MGNSDKWRHWCGMFDRVEGELYEAHYYRWMWRVINTVIDQSNIRKSPQLMGYLNATYVAYVAMFVRRESDTRTDVSSLANCIRYIERNTDTLSREDYLALVTVQCAEPDARAGVFDALSRDGVNLDGRLVRAHRLELLSATAVVKQYANDYLAHRSVNPEGMAPTFGDVDSAMETIEKVAKVFFSLRYPGVALWTATPVGDLGFLHMFESPWFPQGSRLPPDLT